MCWCLENEPPRKKHSHTRTPEIWECKKEKKLLKRSKTFCLWCYIGPAGESMMKNDIRKWVKCLKDRTTTVVTENRINKKKSFIYWKRFSKIQLQTNIHTFWAHWLAVWKRATRFQIHFSTETWTHRNKTPLFVLDEPFHLFIADENKK